MSEAMLNDLKCFVPDSVQLNPSGNGELDGKTFVVKDLVAVANHTSSFGHARWRETHNPSSETALIITKLLNLGARMVALTKLDQLAGSLVGNIGEGDPPINPLYPDRFCGGSSSGSASAVAGGLVDFALGTDTAGSVRVPAAACGLYGLRPTHGSVNSEGVLPWAASFDVVGLLSRDPLLLRQTYIAVSEPVPSKITPINKLLIASDAFEVVSERTTCAMRAVADKLANAKNLAVEEVSFASFVSQAIGDLFARIQTREVWATHAKWITDNKQSLAADLQLRMEAAEKNSAAPSSEIEADLQARLDLSQKLQSMLLPGTALVLPIMYDLAPKCDATNDELQEFRKIAVRLNAPAGLAGTPEVVVPIVVDGHTFGVGILGRANSDIALLDLINLDA